MIFSVFRLMLIVPALGCAVLMVVSTPAESLPLQTCVVSGQEDSSAPWCIWGRNWLVWTQPPTAGAEVGRENHQQHHYDIPFQVFLMLTALSMGCVVLMAVSTPVMSRRRILSMIKVLPMLLRRITMMSWMIVSAIQMKSLMMHWMKILMMSLMIPWKRPLMSMGHPKLLQWILMTLIATGVLLEMLLIHMAVQLLQSKVLLGKMTLTSNINHKDNKKHIQLIMLIPP